MPGQFILTWLPKTRTLDFLNITEVSAAGVKNNALYWESQVEAYGLRLNPAAQGWAPTWLWNAWLLHVQGEEENKKTITFCSFTKTVFQIGWFPSRVNSCSPNAAFTFELLPWWSSLRQQSWTFPLHRKDLYVTTVLISANNGRSRPGKIKAMGHLHSYPVHSFMHLAGCSILFYFGSCLLCHASNLG